MLLERLEGIGSDEVGSDTRALRPGVAVASSHGAEQAEAEGHGEGHQVFERGGAGVHAGSLAGGWQQAQTAERRPGHEDRAGVVEGSGGRGPKTVQSEPVAREQGLRVRPTRFWDGTRKSGHSSDM